MAGTQKATKGMSAARRQAAPHPGDASVKALARLLRARSPKGIASALNDVVVPYLNNPIADLDPLARMIRVLFILDVEATASPDGISRFFWSWPNGVDGGDEGAYAAEAAAFSERIGARRAAKYLREGIALFPGGRVPATESERRTAMSDFNNDATGRPLARLDAKYRGATEEMLVALQRFVAGNREAVIAALRGERRVSKERAQLDSIIAEVDDWRFLDRLLEWARLRTGTGTFDPITELPRALRQLSLVRIFAMDMQSAGCWQFLEHLESPGHLRELATLAERIGAASTAACLRAIPKLFPRGRIPSDSDEREEIVASMEERPGGGPLRALDKKYARASAELVAAYRRHLASDLSGFEQRVAR